MGDWRVRMMWGLPDWTPHNGGHAESFACNAHPPCMWIVEQHQYKGPDVPEFTVSVAWQDGRDSTAWEVKPSKLRGWRYILRWTDPGSGQTKVASSYGYSDEGMCRKEAEAKATEIAKSQRPEKVYKFTPEV
jgi:hypothetical protein